MTEFLITYQWELWAVVALLFLMLELMAGDFFMLCLAVSSACAAVTSALGLGFLGNLAVFAVMAVASLLFLRPRALRRFGGSAHTRRSNADALAGMTGVVSEAIPAGGKGYVAIDGDRWPAVSDDGGGIEAGAKVRVLKHESIVLTVERL